MWSDTTNLWIDVVLSFYGGAALTLIWFIIFGMRKFMTDNTATPAKSLKPAIKKAFIMLPILWVLNFIFVHLII